LRKQENLLTDFDEGLPAELDGGTRPIEATADNSTDNSTDNQSGAATEPGSTEPESTEPESIRLDQFLKLSDVAATGGQAKLMIQDGEVRVNGEVETRRKRKLFPGDTVEFNGEEFVIYVDES
jgi:ribosome-associated protein